MFESINEQVSQLSNRLKQSKHKSQKMKIILDKLEQNIANKSEKKDDDLGNQFNFDNAYDNLSNEQREFLELNNLNNEFVIKCLRNNKDKILLVN